MIRAFVLVAALLASAGGAAAPIVPTADDEVIERLPSTRAPRTAPRSSAEAVARARVLIDAARDHGDPRLAGQAITLLKPWAGQSRANADVVIALATAEQFLHDFGGALARLQALLSHDPDRPQAWLMVATLHRLQGRYAESDSACAQLRRLRIEPHGSACGAENAALRGRFDAARATLSHLLARPMDASTRAWLLTTLAELEERAGRGDAAERAYVLALRTQRDAYTALAYADWLLARNRARDVPRLLADLPRSDAVLLRLARAGDAAAMRELDERLMLSTERPGAGASHAREHALVQLHLKRDAALALRFARANVKTQREPADVLLLAQAARAANDAGALVEARRLAEEIGLHDRRLEALL